MAAAFHPEARAPLSPSLSCAQRTAASLGLIPVQVSCFPRLLEGLRGRSFLFSKHSFIQMCCQMCSVSRTKAIFPVCTLRLSVMLIPAGRPPGCWVRSPTSVLPGAPKPPPVTISVRLFLNSSLVRSSSGLYPQHLVPQC